MGGNVWEWVEDWGAPATAYTPSLYNGDVNHLAGADATYGPAALVRGGAFGMGIGAGVFAVHGAYQPSIAFSDIGFRCTR